MAAARDIVIVGAGHNGLVTAFYLAKAGFRPLVLERRPVVGGAAITEEFHPGFRCSTLAHATGPLLPSIAREMQLARHGLEMIEPETAIFAPRGKECALELARDAAKSAEAIAKFSRKDAEKYVEFAAALVRIGKFLARLLTVTPPEIDKPTAKDFWSLAKLAKGFRGLGKKEMLRLLRWSPMPVADFVAEWFETELLRATVAARGIFGTAMGPWSPGTTAVLLLRAAADSHPAGRTVFPRGGMGALTQAMASAARAAGAEIRTGVEVAQVTVKSGAVAGVVLTSGEEVPAKTVVSNADPKRTLLRLVDPVHLEPDFLAKMQHYRCPGTAAKINLALDGLPDFVALGGRDPNALAGRLHIGPEIDYLERAFDDWKYGNFSRQPYLDVAIPSISDPSLTPPGKHVMSVYSQYAPLKLKEGDWTQRREELAERVVQTLAACAPDLPSRVLARQVITPAELEETYGLTGGHIFHGELSLDQLFTMRPLLGWGRYRTPISGLYLCGSGTHPGNGLTGASGLNAAREIRKDLRK